MHESKRCSRCGETTPLGNFGPSKQTPDGLFRYCRPCKRTADRLSHARHKPQRNASMRAHYRANRASYIARAAAQYEFDRDAIKKRARAWALGNPGRRKEIANGSFRRRYAIDPEPMRESWRRRQAAIRRGCVVYPFTTEQLAAKVAFWAGRCWVCSGPFEAIDHVKPLAKGGPHMLANLRPICTACNTRKRDHWPFEAANS